MRTLKHPSFDNVFVQVEEEDAAGWREQGWKASSKKAADEAGVVFTDESLDTVHAEGVTPSANTSTGASGGETVGSSGTR